MQILVRLSAGLAQVTGQPRVAVEVAADATIAGVAAALVAQYPGLSSRLNHAVPIVDGVHTTLDAALAPGQEVAFLLPVAGGAGSRPCTHQRSLSVMIRSCHEF